MNARKELTAIGAVAALALLASGLGLALGAAGAWALATPAALVVCAGLAATGAWRAARAEAEVRAATFVDRVCGLPNGAQLRDDLGAFLAVRAGGERPDAADLRPGRVQDATTTPSASPAATPCCAAWPAS